MEQKKQNKFYLGIHFITKHLNKSDLAKNIPKALVGFNYTKVGKYTVIINKQTAALLELLKSSPLTCHRQ